MGKPLPKDCGSYHAESNLRATNFSFLLVLASGLTDGVSIELQDGNELADAAISIVSLLEDPVWSDLELILSDEA